MTDTMEKYRASVHNELAGYGRVLETAAAVTRNRRLGRLAAALVDNAPTLPIEDEMDTADQWAMSRDAWRAHILKAHNIALAGAKAMSAPLVDRPKADALTAAAIERLKEIGVNG